jgi:adenosylcobinamide-GDP ribazoletransferase
VSETPPSERPSTFADGVRLAIGTLSVFPVRPGTVDRRAGGIAMTAAPLVGALLGIAGAIVLAGAMRLGITPLPAAVLAVTALALLTRGLHLDGLADLADGLGSGRPAGQALDIMKRSDIGPFGVVTLILTLLVQVAALSEVAAAGTGPVALVTACVAGRLALTWACREKIPAARPGGLGATVAGTVRRVPALAVTALALLGTVALTLVYEIGALEPLFGRAVSEAVLYGVPPDDHTLHGGIMTASEAYAAGLLRPWWGLSAAFVAGLLAAWAVRRRAVRRLGGITGDVLGALVEIATATTLVVYAVTVG